MRNISFRHWIIKKIGTTRIAVLSFVFIILLGSLLLSLPISNLENTGNDVSYLNHLFVATSATCVTGLVPYPLASQYTTFGFIVIATLIQIGGLGVMTLFAFILTLLKEKLYQSEKRLLHDTLNTSSLSEIPRFLHKIFKYTFTFEMIGFILLAFKFVPKFGVSKGLFSSLFLSISAFCNAGMDSFSMNSLIDYVNDPLINFVIPMLIIMGGLGFSVWFDLSSSFKKMSKTFHKGDIIYALKHLQIHTKLVLLMTSALIIFGFVSTYLIEFNNPNTLGPLNALEKMYPAFFTSITLRTAGFATLDMGLCRPASLFIMIFLMLIGGSPGGTAGGIKTTTMSITLRTAGFATLDMGLCRPASLFIMIFLMLIGGSPGGTAGGIKTTTMLVIIITIVTLAKDESADINIWRRRITTKTFMRSMIIASYYFVFLFIALMILLVSDPELSLMTLMYEATSAIATVGLSMNATGLLSEVGRFVIICLMLFGRVGPMSIVLFMMRNHKVKKGSIHYPHADVLIG